MRVFSFILSLTFACSLPAEPTTENLESRQWFQDSKFGLFIHWGVYSELGRGEWVMEKAGASNLLGKTDHNSPIGKMSIEEYEPLASRFNPEQFDPVAWVTMAKEAGMKYITITSKHHDGFAMWGTKQNGWNIVDATPYKKDVLKLLADEAHRQGIKLFFYYSHLDWHHPDYFPLGRTGHFAGRPESGDFNKYLDFMDAQLTELLTNYGPIAGIWFDGVWDKKPDSWKEIGDLWRLEQTYALIHRLQPAALVGNNHHLAPYEGEDFQAFEKDLPGSNTAEFNQTSISALPLETCETINHSWGYNSSDDNFKTTKQLIQYLVSAAGNNANLLLNVGPRPDGTIQPEFIERLKAMGKWTKKNGESIYGTCGGPMSSTSWGVMTHKGDIAYLHILDWKESTLPLPIAAKRARLFPDGPMLAIEDGVLQLPTQLDEIDTIIELQL